MAKFDWRSLTLEPGVYREPTPDANRVTLWLAGEVDDGFQRWERITNVPGAASAEEQGVCFTQADSMHARQKMRGLFGRLVDSLRKSDRNISWLLPTGGYAEQTGERRAGLLLAWPSDETAALDDAGLRLRWPDCSRVRKIAANLFVIYPAEPGSANPATVPEQIDESRNQAEELLTTARKAGDSAKEAAALADLGIALTRAGDGHRAVTILEEAVALARRLDDRVQEYDTLANLGMAYLAVGQGDQAESLLGDVLSQARTAGERHEERLALANLATVLATAHDFSEALAAAEHALLLARELGDRAGEADLLWFQAVQNAELGRPGQAAALAQAAIDIHAALRSPHVRWLQAHLKKYRPLAAGPRRLPGAVPTSYYTGATNVAETPEPAADPGLLRNALAAVKALEASTGSGLKMVSPQILEQRLQTCKACQHHTGLRCRLCNHFTRTKARLPYEACPAGKWPA